MNCKHCGKRLIGYLLNAGSNGSCNECRENVEELATESNVANTLRATLHRTELRRDELELEVQLARRERDEARIPSADGLSTIDMLAKLTKATTTMGYTTVDLEQMRAAMDRPQ